MKFLEILIFTALQVTGSIGFLKSNDVALCDRGDSKFKCSLDKTSLGYCHDNRWWFIEKCKRGSVCDDYAHMCRDESIENMRENVKCMSSSISLFRVPNFMDDTCTTFYECGSSEAKLRACLPGSIFDYCSGFCKTSAVCLSGKSCNGISSSNVTRLLNSTLGHFCFQNERFWIAFPMENRIEKHLSFPLEPNTCMNGVGDSGNCREPGFRPIPGTNCGIRVCREDLTYIDEFCEDGDVYDYARESCLAGICTPLI